MSKENVEIVRSVLAPMEHMDGASVDWNAEFVRELLGATYSPDIELRTLASGTGTGLSEVYQRPRRLGRVPARMA